MTYQEKLKDPRWLVKRDKLLQNRDEKCQLCGTSDKLTIHHGYYRPKGDPWDYEDESLWILCWTCHMRSQKILTDIHQKIGHINPGEYEDLKQEIGGKVFEFQFGISEEELSEIFRKEKDIESTLYSEYSVSIISSAELGPTRAYYLEDALRLRYPGLEICVSTRRGDRDCSVSVSGPDQNVVSRIEAWCENWQG